MTEENPIEEAKPLNEQEIQLRLTEVISETLSRASFTRFETLDMAGQVAEECIEKLSQLKVPYKFMVECNLGQNAGGGKHAMIASYWDEVTDGYVSIEWSNKTLHCIVNVFYVGI